MGKRRNLFSESGRIILTFGNRPDALSDQCQTHGPIARGRTPWELSVVGSSNRETVAESQRPLLGASRHSAPVAASPRWSGHAARATCSALAPLRAAALGSMPAGPTLRDLTSPPKISSPQVVVTVVTALDRFLGRQVVRHLSARCRFLDSRHVAASLKSSLDCERSERLQVGCHICDARITANLRATRRGKGFIARPGLVARPRNEAHNRKGRHASALGVDVGKLLYKPSIELLPEAAARGGLESQLLFVSLLKNCRFKYLDRRPSSPCFYL